MKRPKAIKGDAQLDKLQMIPFSCPAHPSCPLRFSDKANNFSDKANKFFYKAPNFSDNRLNTFRYQTRL
jgi:hypothetical protein